MNWNAIQIVACAAALVVESAAAQSPYGTTTQATPAWGGRTVVDPIPYQPGPLTQPQPATIVPAPSPPPAQTSLNSNPGQVWQAYPAPDAVQPTTVPNGLVPATGPLLPMQAPIYSSIPPTEQSPGSLLPPGTRNGVFQKAKFTGTWMPQLQNDSLGWTDLRSEIVFGLPFFTRETPIVITPAYEAHFLDRPVGFDLPPRLHDLSIDFHHFRRIGDHWIADVALTPGIYADDHSFDSSDAFRLNGRAVGVYTPSPEWKWVLGVTYVDGGWSKVVPVAGVVYEPNDDVEYDLVFPSPKIAWRLASSPIPGKDEYWVYVAAEFGNAIWAIEQTDGTPDVFASRDYRLLFGFERKIIGGLSSRAELGYVFNRDIKTASVPGDVHIDDTLLFRVGLVY